MKSQSEFVEENMQGESIDSNRQTLQNENAIPLTIEELAECITGGSK